MTKLSVRAARIADAAAIGEIQVQTLPAAIQSGTDQPLELAFSAAELAAQWEHTIANLPGPNFWVLVAVAGEVVQGFAAVMPAEPVILEGDDATGLDDDGIPRVAFEITNLDVPAQFATAGHAERLLAAATDLANEAGGREVHMWVIAGNDPQTQLLGGAGFAPRPVRRVAEINGAEIAEHLWWALIESAPSA
ncbi:MAG: hypothetical protein Q4E03_03375 [Trueperella sp.]|nr:hypothetical protein [Trueperella sp.]